MPNLLPSLLIFIIWIGSTLLAAIPFAALDSLSFFSKLVSVIFAPLLFVVSFPIISGLLSKFGQKGIIRGKFPRQLLHKVYLLRRIYGACWTQLYYFKPIYAVMLAVPIFKKLVFRLFGYKGSVDFIVYPDTWIRDLPLLNIGSGAYLSNRATIGTNICLPNGMIMVDNITVEEKGLIGHLSVLGAGCKIGEKAEIGIGCIIGLRAKVKAGVRIRPWAGINHGAKIGENVDIGASSYIGILCEIADGLKIPPGANIPDGAILRVQADVEKYYSSETEKLHSHKDQISTIINKHDEEINISNNNMSVVN